MKILTNRQKQAVETKLKITETALNLFKEHGYDAVRVKDICQAANISVGAFYHHFESKENILTTGYKQIEILIASVIDAHTYKNPIDRLYAIYDKAAKIIQNLGWNFISQVYRQLLNSNYKHSLSDERYTYVNAL